MGGPVFFLVIFVIVVATIAISWTVLEGQKKKKVTEMLQSAVGEAERVETKVLLDAERGEKNGLEQLMSRFNFVKRLDLAIQQAGMDTNVNTVLTQMLIAGVVCGLIGLKLNLVMFPVLSMFVGGLIGGMVPYALVKRRRSKRMGQFEEQFPEALEFLSRAMRAGHAFSIALEMLSEESPDPLKTEFRKVFNEHNLGLPIEAALENLTSRVPMLDVRFFVSAVLLQRETGGNLAEILTKLAFVIRERFKLKGQVRSASAHGRITGSILTLMPVCLMVGLMVVAPSYLTGMAEDPDGKIMIACCIVMMIIGHFIIRKIVNIKV